jgi:hypothetical protein
MATMNLASLNTVPADADDLKAEIEGLVNADGYAIISNVLDAATCTSLIAEVDRQHPLTLLGEDVQPEMVWEKMKRSE